MRVTLHHHKNGKKAPVVMHDLTALSRRKESLKQMKWLKLEEAERGVKDVKLSNVTQDK